MMKKTLLISLLTIAGMGNCFADVAAQPADTYLCCNAWADKDGWISDINYRKETNLIPAGTKVRVTGYGRFRVHLDMNGRPLNLGNDYSRTISDQELAKRWIVTADPKVKLAKSSQKIQQAILNGKLVIGMTPDEVLMSMGYPVTSENPELDLNKVKFWRYWLSSFDEVAVIWKDGVLKEVKANPGTYLNIVVE